MELRELYGMSYKSIEIDHDIRVPMSEVLAEFAHYTRVNSIQGYPTSLSTQSHPDDEDRFLTTLVYVTF